MRHTRLRAVKGKKEASVTEIIFVLLYLLAVLWLERMHRAERAQLYERMGFGEGTDRVKHRDREKRKMPQYPYTAAAKRWRDPRGGESR